MLTFTAMTKYLYVHLHHKYYRTRDLLEDYKACYTGSANHTIEYSYVRKYLVSVNLNLMMLHESYSPTKVLC